MNFGIEKHESVYPFSLILSSTWKSTPHDRRDRNTTDKQWSIQPTVTDLCTEPPLMQSAVTYLITASTQGEYSRVYSLQAKGCIITANTIILKILW